jgi:DNA-binding NtrC family response regulator
MTNAESTQELEFGSASGAYRISVQYERECASRTLRPGEGLLIGSGDGVELRVSDPAVSSVHAEVRVMEHGVVVSDRGSRNGMYVGGGRVSEALLRGPCAEILIGRSTVRVVRRDSAKRDDDLGLLGDTEVMRSLRAQVRRFARLRAPVLVLGESGTGKDVVARALYQASGLKGAYVATNVAALSDGLIDAELFGHTKGAFTGAVGARAGAFQLADQGLLFLDEIAELCPAGQAKLLRVVEDGRVRPLGSDREMQVTPRLVFATCAPLLERVALGRFREDLYHRISVLTLEVPPLRARKGDIPLLVRAFLDRRVEEFGRRTISDSGMEYLLRQRWPGNVRQLFSCVYAACANSSEQVISPCHLLVNELDERGPELNPAAALRILESSVSMSEAARRARMPRTSFRTLVARAKAT